MDNEVHYVGWCEECHRWVCVVRGDCFKNPNALTESPRECLIHTNQKELEDIHQSGIEDVLEDAYGVPQGKMLRYLPELERAGAVSERYRANVLKHFGVEIPKKGKS